MVIKWIRSKYMRIVFPLNYDAISQYNNSVRCFSFLLVGVLFGWLRLRCYNVCHNIGGHWRLKVFVAPCEHSQIIWYLLNGLTLAIEFHEWFSRGDTDLIATMHMHRYAAILAWKLYN